MPDLKVARSRPGLAVVDDKLIMFGGCRNENTSLYEIFEGNNLKQSQSKHDNLMGCRIFIVLSIFMQVSLHEVHEFEILLACSSLLHTYNNLSSKEHQIVCTYRFAPTIKLYYNSLY